MAIIDLKELTLKCQDILDSLPKSHYLRVSTINVELSLTEQTSYFLPQKFTICVAMNNILNALNNAKSKISDAEIERIIRGLLYHEISHAILTPKDLMQIAIMIRNNAINNNNAYFSIISPDFANIIEDERIETLLRNYYMNVDFKKNLHLICPLVKQPKSFEHFVFNCVRFRYSPVDIQKVQQLVSDFIKDTKNVNCNKSSYDLLLKMVALLNELKRIYDTFAQQNQQNNQNQTKSSQNGNEEESSSNQLEDDNGEQNQDSQPSNDGSENDENAENEESKSNSEGSQDHENQDIDLDNQENAENETDDNTLSQEDAENAIAEAIGSHCCSCSKVPTIDIFKSNFETRSKLKAIIQRNCGIGCAKAQIIYSQNGRFNQNAFIKDKQRQNQTYNWFSKKNTDAENKTQAQNVKILNIWLDNSGSYDLNDFETNKILKALCEIEKSRNDFKFRLITFGSYYTEKFGNQRVSCSTQGTSLKDFKKWYNHYNTGKEFNIFLMDGTGNAMNELSCLNNKKSALIVDKDVANYIKSNNLCPNARSITSVGYGDSYPKLLAENVLKAFDLLF